MWLCGMARYANSSPAVKLCEKQHTPPVLIRRSAGKKKPKPLLVFRNLLEREN